MSIRFLLLPQSLILAVAFSNILYFGSRVIAADQVVLKYGIFNQSVSVKELSTFVETGQSTLLQTDLTLARQDPNVVRQYLTEPVKVNPVFLDRVLNSPIGNALLDEVSQAVHTPSRRADRQALRAALVLSASQDRKITLLKVIQNYPASEVEVEGDRLKGAYTQLRRLRGRFQDLLGSTLHEQ